MKYTITRKELIAACRARSEQVKTAKAELAKATETLASKWEGRRVRREMAPRIYPAWAHVAMVNGNTYRAALPVTRLKQWAQCAPADVLECSIAPGPDNTLSQITLTAGTSSITLWGRQELDSRQIPGSGRYCRNTHATWLGDPIRLVAPAEGGAFVYTP